MFVNVLYINNKSLTMEIFNNLPYELRVLVNTFSVEHRPKLATVHVDLYHKSVMDEIIYNNSLTYCSNDMCENNILKNKSVMSEILGYEHYFCDEECQSYGEWSIRYDYRKRKNRYANRK